MKNNNSENQQYEPEKWWSTSYAYFNLIFGFTGFLEQSYPLQVITAHQHLYSEFSSQSKRSEVEEKIGLQHGKSA